MMMLNIVSKKLLHFYYTGNTHCHSINKYIDLRFLNTLDKRFNSLKIRNTLYIWWHYSS